VAALGSGYSVYNKNNIAVTGTHSYKTKSIGPSRASPSVPRL
jgi:hypothetical protein